MTWKVKFFAATSLVASNLAYMAVGQYQNPQAQGSSSLSSARSVDELLGFNFVAIPIIALSMLYHHMQTNDTDLGDLLYSLYPMIVNDTPITFIQGTTHPQPAATQQNNS